MTLTTQIYKSKLKMAIFWTALKRTCAKKTKRKNKSINSNLSRKALQRPRIIM